MTHVAAVTAALRVAVRSFERGRQWPDAARHFRNTLDRGKKF
jgi:hypothetical protein